MELRARCLAVLRLADPAAKAAQTRALFDALPSLDIDADARIFEPAELPGRPPTPRLVPATAVPRRSPFTDEGRAATSCSSTTASTAGCTSCSSRIEARGERDRSNLRRPRPGRLERRAAGGARGRPPARAARHAAHALPPRGDDPCLGTGRAAFPARLLAPAHAAHALRLPRTTNDGPRQPEPRRRAHVPGPRPARDRHQPRLDHARRRDGPAQPGTPRARRLRPRVHARRPARPGAEGPARHGAGRRGLRAAGHPGTTPVEYEAGEAKITCRSANGVSLVLDFLKTPFGDRSPHYNTKLGTCPVTVHSGFDGA